MFIFKNTSAMKEAPTLIDWTDLGKPPPDEFSKLDYAIGLERVVYDVRDIFDDDIIINGKPSDWFLKDLGGFNDLGGF